MTINDLERSKFTLDSFGNVAIRVKDMWWDYAPIPLDASSWELPVVSTAVAWFIVSVAGTLPEPIWAVNVWDIVSWDGDATWTLISYTVTWDVAWPASATDAAIAIFDGITGKILKDSLKLLSELQDTLVSGTNIKTINWESILWSWDLTVSGWHTIQDEWVSLTQRTKLNFVGSWVTVTDGGAGTDDTIITINTGWYTLPTATDLILWGIKVWARLTMTGDILSADVQTTDISGKVDKNTAITWATKTKITYDAKGLVTSWADATTADIADSLNKRYITDAQLTVIGNTSWTNTWDQTITNSSDWTSHTVTLSASGWTLQLVEWENITLTTTWTAWAGIVTIAGSAGWAADNSIAYIAM